LSVCVLGDRRIGIWDITYANGDGTALARLLDGDGVRLSEVGAPVSATDGDNVELGNDDGGTDGGSDFLGGLDTETDVAVGVTNEDDSLEAGTLTGTGLLLDRLDLLEDFRQYAVLARVLPLAFSPGFFGAYRTFMTSSLREGRKKSTIWYSLIGRE
jgi:hypothetical protein